MKQEPEKEPIKSKRTFGDALWVIGLLLAAVLWGIILIDAMKGYQEDEAYDAALDYWYDHHEE